MLRSLLVGSLVLLAALTACGGEERSAEAFCSTFASESERLGQKYQQRAGSMAEQDDLAALFVGVGSLLEAQGDMVVLFDRLERNAPPSIAHEVAAVRDALKAQAEALTSGDLVQAGAGGLITALQAQGSAERVDAFILANC